MFRYTDASKRRRLREELHGRIEDALDFVLEEEDPENYVPKLHGAFLSNIIKKQERLDRPLGKTRIEEKADVR